MRGIRLWGGRWREISLGERGGREVVGAGRKTRGGVERGGDGSGMRNE